MEEVLVYVKPICKNTNNTFEYDLFFSETPDYVWGPNWDIDTPNINGDMTPEESTCSSVVRIRTKLPLKTFEETSCYSFEYVTYGIFALAWIDIENLDAYPEIGRMVFHFKDKKADVLSNVTLVDWEVIN